MTHELPPPNTKPSRPELSSKPADNRLISGLIIGFVVVVLILIGITYLLITYANPNVTGVLRDVSIILLAFINMFIGIILLALVSVLVYLVLKINDLVQLINRETEPLLKKANEAAATANDTVKTVQSKVVVVSDEAVKPVVNVLSSISATKAIIKTLFKRDG